MAADWLKDPAEWSRDDWVAFLAISLGAGTLLLTNGPKLAPWLKQHRVVLEPDTGLITIPGLGDLDLPRILTVAAGLVLLALLIIALRRPGRTQPYPSQLTR